MLRAAVLIGVSKTGGLPTLQAVESGIAQMKSWAIAQGIEGDRLVVITDATDEVRAHRVGDAIETLVNRRDLDQLIVYFAGHGVNNRSDVWLLSQAPGKTSEAVNVEGSIQLARFCGIDHVVLISDACRTVAPSVVEANVIGIEIFPNDPVDGMERHVDVFFACARGRPALEVNAIAQASENFSALYTEALWECLTGKRANAFERTQEGGAEIGLVRPWKLADELLATVPKRLKEKLGRTPSTSQTPVARINSRPAAWVSRITAEDLAQDTLGPVEVLACGNEESSDRYEQLLNGIRAASRAEALGWGPNPMTDRRESIAGVRSGFKLEGAKVLSARAIESMALVTIGAGGMSVSVELQSKPVSVLLEFTDGNGALLPVMPDFVAELTFVVGELAQINYQSSASNVPRTSEGRALRCAIEEAAGAGLFRMTEAYEALIASNARTEHSLDPSISLYAAYAYHEVGNRAPIRKMQKYLQIEFGFTFFDLALLAASGSLKARDATVPILPTVPMLSQGWSLLKAFRTELPSGLIELQSHLRPSLWTLFNPEGTRRLAEILIDKKVSE